MNMFKKNGGFTLVELIVVIAILAILAAVAIPTYSKYISKANDSADLTALSAVKTAAMGALAAHGTVSEVTVTVDENGTVSEVSVVYGSQDTELRLYPVDTSSDKNKAAGEDFYNYLNGEFPTLKGKYKDGAVWSNNDWAVPSSNVTTETTGAANEG